MKPSLSRYTRRAALWLDRAAGRLSHPLVASLAIFDDVFPNVLTGFRVAEFSAYLDEFPDAVALCGRPWFAVKPGLRPFKKILDEYAQYHPTGAARVHQLQDTRRIRADLAYWVFLNNCLRFRPIVERNGLPFAFTLYPGGGFHLDQPDTDAALRSTFDSPLFRQVVVTQQVTFDYLSEKQFVDPARMRLLRGGVLQIAPPSDQPRPRFGDDKANADICFAASKYSPGGLDKGYDLFVEAAHQVHAARRDVRFHVIGDFDPADQDLRKVRDVTTFHGHLPRARLHEVFRAMDVIVAPSRPFVLQPGAFDGFPLGSCVEAAACGVAMIATDALNENQDFVPNHDLVLVAPDAGEIAARLIELLERPDDLDALRRHGEAAVRRIYSFERQVEPRISMLSEYLAK